MTSFFAEFAHTDNGVSCSDSGLRDLSTTQECSGAVSYAKTFNSKANYRSEGSYSSHFPKGCHIWTWGDMYFNTHSIGERHPSIASICMKGNT